jgi:hypothetical protein
MGKVTGYRLQGSVGMGIGRVASCRLQVIVSALAVHEWCAKAIEAQLNDARDSEQNNN